MVPTVTQIEHDLDDQSSGGLYAHTEMFVYTKLGESVYVSETQSGMMSTEVSFSY